MDTVTGPASLDVRAVSVTSQALSPFMPPESIAQIEGALDATVHLEASSLEWASLQGEARLDRFGLTVEGVSLTQQEPTRIGIERGIAQVMSWNWTGRGGASLVVQGEGTVTRAAGRGACRWTGRPSAADPIPRRSRMRDG